MLTGRPSHRDELRLRKSCQSHFSQYADTGTQVSRKLLLADVANLPARKGRLAAQFTRLERRLSETLGQTAWEASGLGAPVT
jgi:hypothetical protein